MNVRPHCWRRAGSATDSSPNGCRSPAAAFWSSRPTTWRSRTGPLCTKRSGASSSMVFERISMHEPGPAEPGQRDLLEVLFWVTSAEGAAVGRTLIWRVYVVDRGGIAIACETPLLVTRGLLVLSSPSMAEDLRAKALLIVRPDGTTPARPDPRAEISHAHHRIPRRVRGVVVFVTGRACCCRSSHKPSSNAGCWTASPTGRCA